MTLSTRRSDVRPIGRRLQRNAQGLAVTACMLCALLIGLLAACGGDAGQEQVGVREKTATTQQAVSPGKVLILGSTVTGGTSSVEATQAGALGFGVDVVDDATWGAMSTAQFAAYNAIILGDPTCAVGTAPIAAAMANSATWGAAVTGNVIILGTDEVFHGKTQVTINAITFATAKPGTGAFISLSCYYDSTAFGTPVPVLNPFGSFTARGVSCFNNVHIVAESPALAGLTDAYLSGWSCSIHEAFDGFPTGTFVPLAIANAIGGDGSMSFADGTSGVPYILVRGAAPVLCGDGIVQSTEECDDGTANGTCGDKCSSICKLHWCGDGVVDPGEACDLGCMNGASGSACSATCTAVATATPPSCALTAVVAGPPKQLDITVQSSAGLASINVTDSTNATVSVPAFASGDTSAQTVVATKVDQSTGAHVALHITDVNGNATDCDPLVPGEPVTSSASSSHGSAGGCSVGSMQQGGVAAGLSGLLSFVGLALLRRRSGARKDKR